MKALILAAGLGTRLLPFTQTVPKPLFPVSDRTLLDGLIERLGAAGCEVVAINTHHLAGKIEAHIEYRRYSIPVHLRHESEILGTGGAIKNLEDFWDHRPFLVINSDIVTDMDLGAVYRFHERHPYPVTLVLYDCPEFNTVSVDSDDFVGDFSPKPEATRRLTFTGIQVLDPEVLAYIPKGAFSSVIDAYRRLMAAGKRIKAYIPARNFWIDIGTPQRYDDIIVHRKAPEAFGKAFPEYAGEPIRREPLTGDGSDRRWHRLTSADRSLVLVGHGIQIRSETTEFDAFVAIGRHLLAKGVPVPKIFLWDRFSGQVYLEDLGDLHLQSVINGAEGADAIRGRYQVIIGQLVRMSLEGADGFDPAWTCQSPAYSRQLIMEKECRYFLDAFLRGYLGRTESFNEFQDEFENLATRAANSGVIGFMHRDFQSRNIMVKGNRYYFIDFQGGRKGPIQYDLASLLIDPYVSLPAALRYELLDYAAARVSAAAGIDETQFKVAYRYCTVTRNLQILGAFGYLTRVKSKPAYEKYIPAALKTLQESLREMEFPKLRSGVENINAGIRKQEPYAHSVF